MSLLSLTEQSSSLTQQSLLMVQPSSSLVHTDLLPRAPTRNHLATPTEPPPPTIVQQTDAPNAPQSHRQLTRTSQRSKQTSTRQFLANDIHQQQTSQNPHQRNPPILDITANILPPATNSNPNYLPSFQDCGAELRTRFGLIPCADYRWLHA